MPQYLSKEKLTELEGELKKLTTTDRQEVAERLRRAKEFGDLSENSEYNEAKDEQAQLEYRISEVEQILREAEIISKSAQKDKVSIGSSVTVTKPDGSKADYHIVGPHEVDPDTGKISNESPVGSSLLDRQVGEEVTVITPNGPAKYKINSIN